MIASVVPGRTRFHPVVPEDKQMGRRASRNIGFKAFADTDRDIVTWWNRLPDGERSEILRQIIRTAMGGGSNPVPNMPIASVQSSPDFARVQEDTAWIRRSLSDLPAYLERLISQTAFVSNPSVEDEVSVARLADEALNRRRERMNKATW